LSAVLAPLAVSLGDPAGVGPELIGRAWARYDRGRAAPFVVFGGRSVLAERIATLRLDCPVCVVASPAEGAACFKSALPVIAIEPDPPSLAGRPEASGAQLALASLAASVDAVLAGGASAIVTAPVSKSALATIGHRFAGQTEYLANRAGLVPENAVMMLAGPSLRTVPLTVHCALAEVPGRLTQDLIVARTRITAAALSRDFGIERPRIAVSGLNPHSGESGAFGDEEARIIVPAINRLISEGFDVSGPHPADALFAPRQRQSFDVAMCMYHDQALIPVKALDFDQGVNVTLGLPFVRTSPDHGTAFDIAGKGIADPGALLAALRMAEDCARRRSVRAGG
jgi:4-hydroxythreonine-4-phosphate dehydrogenase